VKRAAALLACLCWALGAQAGPDSWRYGGHLKSRPSHYAIPDDSVLGDAWGSSTTSQGFEGRLNFAKRANNWTFQADYQLLGVRSETFGGGWGGALVPVGNMVDDQRRWFDLTGTLSESDESVWVHRLDRLSVGYTGERSVIRFGRQAISWGNGLMFNPMDIINPFDPAAIDTEYKTGDDMLYGQYLFDSGSDLQAVAVVRRNPASGDVEKEQSSLAIKYHGFFGTNEFDLLAAGHYDDLVLAAGGNFSLGGAVWRGDVTWTETPTARVLSAMTGVTYSWTWGGRNVSGLLEYYYNGFGQKNRDYAPLSLLRNPDLLRRIERGELYTLGRHYAGASATIELTPLFLLTPSLFVNLLDPSALLQVLARYDWRQDLQLLAALNLPVGAAGTEYGGIETIENDRYLSTGASVLLQLGWYF
jgi:hypothetical protein